MEINKLIDHTNLKQTATLKDIEKLCKEAMQYHFETVCVPPYYIMLAKELLKNTNVLVTTVVGFPNGYQTVETKVYEAIDAVSKGASEIDMVININALKNKDYDYVKEEIEQIRDAIDGKVLKVIIETSLLEEEEIIKMTEICNETFVNFIKTSTGFGKRGASVSDIKTIMEHKNEVLEVKASGGIKTLKQVEEFMELGVSRIGTSHGVEIMEEIK